MKHRMNTPTRIHFQLIRYRSHHLHDFKWTNSFGEKLARLLAMLQIKVLRTQQHLISDLQGLLNSILVCKRFLSLLSRNQTFACKAERRLQTLNESSRRWVHDFNNLTHWSPRMIAVSQLKRGRTDGLVNRCIMGDLCT
jgi:hypothetical protein